MLKIFLGFVCIVFLSFSSQAKTVIDLYMYTDKPPYMIDSDLTKGLSHDFVAALNDHSNEFKFKLLYAPKARAHEALNQNNSGILWVNSRWFDDANQQKYLWSDDLIYDKEIFITHNKSFKYKDLKSLHNKTIVGTRGYFYFNLDALFEKRLLERVNVRAETYIPTFLIKKRADIGVMGFQTYFYLLRQNPQLGIELVVLENYDYKFTRSIMFDKKNVKVAEEINTWLRSEKGKKSWQTIKSKWLTELDESAKIPQT